MTVSQKIIIVVCLFVITYASIQLVIEIYNFGI